MSKVWELVSLSEGDAVTIRVPHYVLTVANLRCIPSDDDNVVILLDKITSKFRFAPRITCDRPPSKT